LPRARRWAIFPAMENAGVTADRQVETPDFRHVTDWIFDLDNTLYRADNGIFAQIEARMTDYVERLTSLPRDEARVLQKSLYREHGTTLNGLMREHGVDAEDYLAFVHDIDLGDLIPDARLVSAITSLPGRRFVFTNGCRNHAARILARIGMDGLFEQVWDIRSMDFVPKPQAPAYDSVVAAGGVDCPHAAMFDDIPRNLVAARALGMTTVLVSNPDMPWASHGPQMAVAASDISFETTDLCHFLHSIRTSS
jgi:putative hydrolase of the HAD superfamily